MSRKNPRKETGLDAQLQGLEVEDPLLKCDLCGGRLDTIDPSWRSDSIWWQHKCRGLQPQAGHPGRGVPV